MEGGRYKVRELEEKLLSCKGRVQERSNSRLRVLVPEIMVKHYTQDMVTGDVHESALE